MAARNNDHKAMCKSTIHASVWKHSNLSHTYTHRYANTHTREQEHGHVHRTTATTFCLDTYSNEKKSINMKGILKDKDINIRSCSFLFSPCGCCTAFIYWLTLSWKSMRISMAWKMDNKTNYYYNKKKSILWIVCERLWNGSMLLSSPPSCRTSFFP